MFNSIKVCSALFLTIALCVGCGKNLSRNVGNSSGTINNLVSEKRVDWPSIPRQYDPAIEDIDFRTEGLEKIKVDIFGFKNDVEVVYSSEVPAGSGFLRSYKVIKDSEWKVSLKSRPNGSNLVLEPEGFYQCSIRITNGAIVALKGGCFVRLQVFLPNGSDIEVYNIGELLTKRFHSINTKEFLKQLDDATLEADKLTAIENYVAYYNNGSIKKLSLTSQQLGVVIGEFNGKVERFKALVSLHSIVNDRENLEKMIDDQFRFSEKEEARRIVGL